MGTDSQNGRRKLSRDGRKDTTKSQSQSNEKPDITETGKVELERYCHLVELEKYCQTHIYLENFVFDTAENELAKKFAKKN